MPGTLQPEQCEVARLPRGQKIFKLQDGGGLFLLVDKRSKGWRLRYRFNGKDALMSLGVYPAVSLAQARAKATEYRAKLGSGENPAAAKAQARAQAHLQGAKTFGVVAAEYNATQAHRSPKTQERCARMLRHSGKLHTRTLDKIQRPDILALCRVLENVGKVETSHRLGIYFSQVFRYARDEGYFTGNDPTQGGFGKSLKPVREVHRAALTDPKALRSLILTIDTAWLESQLMGVTVARALQLLARTAVRPGELRMAEWREVDLAGVRHKGAPTWVIPVARMKMADETRPDHVVPLSTQAVEILKEQHELTGHGRYVFPNERSADRPMSDGALPAAMIALGYRGKQTAHGFRGTFKTLAHDTLKADSELVERQLAHRVGSEVARAYDRSQRIEERRKLMQDYSDLLERLRDG